MSDGKFVNPIVANGDRIIGWGRGPEMVLGAAHHKELGTDLRFLRYIDGEVVTIDKAAQDAIVAADQQAAANAAANAEAQANAARQAAEQAAAALAADQAAWVAMVQGLRDSYAAATAQLCAIAGVAPVRCMTMSQINELVIPLLSGESANMVNGLLTLLTNLEGKLCRVDGRDALDRV